MEVTVAAIAKLLPTAGPGPGRMRHGAPPWSTTRSKTARSGRKLTSATGTQMLDAGAKLEGQLGGCGLGDADNAGSRDREEVTPGGVAR